MVLISDIIVHAADQHQRSTPADGDGDEFGIQAGALAKASSIREQISAHLLERAVAGVAIDSKRDRRGSDGSSNGEEEEEATKAVLSLLDSCLTTVYLGTEGKKKAANKRNKKKNAPSDDDDDDKEQEEGSPDIEAEEAVAGEWSESVESILQLAAALGCSTNEADESVAVALMDRSALLSDVASDAVRSYACTFVGLCVHHLCRSMNGTGGGDKMDGSGTSFLLPSKSSNSTRDDDMADDEDDQDDWRINCLDKAGAILLPRLTDKAQAVRCAAIRACSGFFVNGAGLCDKNENESSLLEIREAILDALLGRMAHDASFTNRCAAIQSVPITEDTVPYLLERVGDVKEKVRVEALDVMRNRVDVVEDLTEEQRVDVLRFGLTSR